jgi:acyl-coenzyme A thioesterase PaaI-like protein
MDILPKLNLEPVMKGYDMCFGCGETNPIGLKLKFKWDGTTARAEFTAGKNLQGWSGYIHGGIIACILDEAMGTVAMCAGYTNVTAKMQTRYRKMAPIETPLLVSCTITNKTSRLIETDAKLSLQDGTVLAEATSTQFIIGPREENWKL